MVVSQEIVEKIQSFSQKRQRAEEEYERRPLSSSAFQAYNRKLDETLRELQDQVKRQEDELKKLRESSSIDFSNIGTDPWVRVSQARRAKKAYDSLLQAKTELPDAGSPLPVLLAIEETSRLVKESKASVSLTAESLSADRQRLKVEEANLRDAQLITTGLEGRIERIRNERSEKEEKTPSQLADELITLQREKNERLGTATEALKKSLDKFIDETLASMLAAEDLGGPSVGDAMEISDAMLQAGYTNHGKPRKPKTASQDSSQQRIDQLVRRQAGQGNAQATGPSSKRETAAAEMHSLLDALLEAGTSYIDLPRDSAASRFLVKAKVAQFHPRDATRLRLIDFGRSLDD